jgi:redox-sensitive bicupin YhaK (pirin superfamily)
MIEHRRWAELGGADLGWLKAKYHFYVGGPSNPAHTALGSLVVWNDDEIEPGRGFPVHGHKNMEIITYVRQGALAHRDSLGNVGRIEAGDVQVMSTGTGIRHHEHNPEDIPLKLFQIWIRPREHGGAPQWDCKSFPKNERAGCLVPLASGLQDDGEALPIRSDARVLGATLAAGDAVEYPLPPGRNAYMALTLGSVTVNDRRIEAGDGVAIRHEPLIKITALTDTELVLVDAG